MARINQIEGSDIERLNHMQFPQLLAVLLYNEARQREITKHGIHVPTKINVADGGEDGRWDAPLAPVSVEIPNAFTIYQIKADDVAPAEWAEEVVTTIKPKKAKTRQKPKAKAIKTVKPAVAEAFKRKGCYCVFCSERYNTQQINSRVKKIQAAIGKVDPKYKKLPIQFLDADKIATWVNRHTAAVAFVANALSKASHPAMRDWRTWSRDPALSEYEFQSNGYLDQHIADLRQVLQTPRQIARVYGPSGVGKTRFVYEVLRPSSAGGTAPDATLAETIVYCDLATNEDDKVEAIQQIAQSGMQGLLVVDNCAPPVHGKLAGFVGYRGANISLLTVDYEERKLQSDGTAIELEPRKIVDVVPKILRKIPQFANYTDPQINSIAQFCEGYPQIAVLMAKLKAAPSIEQLNADLLLDRLIWGRQPRDPAALNVLRVLAVFAAVGVDGDVANQLTFVRKELCQLANDQQLRRMVEPFKKLRIIQPAGNFWIVAPRPLAVALAASWWEETTAQGIKELLPELERVKLLDPMCNQLKFLGFSNRLNEITRDLCGPTGPFVQAELMFSTAGSQLFRSLVEISPEPALDALHTLMADLTTAELTKVGGTPRRNLVWALEKLCWPASLFPRAATLLLRFAAAENESWSNNATGHFKQLFQTFLAGTQQPALSRLDVIREALETGDEPTRLICVDGLGEALRVGTFTRSGGVEVRGSSLPEEDWKPTTHKEIWEYHEAAFRLLLTLARESSPVGAKAVHTAGQKMRVIAREPLFDGFEQDLLSLANHLRGYWPEARSSIALALEHDLKSATPRRKQVETLLAALSPVEVSDQIRQFVTHAGYHPVKQAGGDYVDLSANAAADLGAQLGPRWSQDAATIFGLLRGRHDKAVSFGEGLARTVLAPDAFLEAALGALKQIPAAEQSAALIIGFLLGLKKPEATDQVLAQLVEDPGLALHYFAIARTRALTKENVEVVIRLIRAGKLPAAIVAELAYGRAVDGFSAQEIADLLVPLAEAHPEAISPVYDVLSMYAFNAPVRWNELRGAIRRLMLLPRFLQSLSQREDHHWETHCEAIFGKGRDPELAASLITQIVTAEETEEDSHSLDSTRKRVLALLFSAHGDITWPIFGAGLLREHEYRLTGLLSADDHSMMVPGQRTIDEAFSSPFWNLDEAVVIPWLQQYPDAVPAIFRSVALFVTEPDNTFSWHPLILRMLREFYKPDHASEIGSNLWSFGSTGSRVPYLRRRIKLLESLRAEKKPALRALADRWAGYFKTDLQAEIDRDSERAAGLWHR